MKNNITEETFKKYRYISLFGVFIFIICLAFAGYQLKNPPIPYIGLAGSLIGWFIFSTYHTKIAIHQLHKITEEYINSVKK